MLWAPAGLFIDLNSCCRILASLYISTSDSMTCVTIAEATVSPQSNYMYIVNANAYTKCQQNIMTESKHHSGKVYIQTEDKNSCSLTLCKSQEIQGIKNGCAELGCLAEEEKKEKKRKYTIWPGLDA